MQATFQFPQHRKLFATKVIKELESEAFECSKGKFLKMIDDADENVAQKIIEYSRMQNWIYKKDIDEQEKFLPGLSRIKSEAITAIVDRKAANELQLRKLGLSEKDILFEIELRQLLADWVELETDISLPIRQGIRDIAVDGKRIDYNKLNELLGDLRSLKDREKDLVHDRFFRLNKDENDDTSEKLREISYECIKVKKEITKEKRRISEVKSKVPNLCYFILYDECFRPEYNPITINLMGYEYQESVSYRIQHLSKYYLTIMVGVICNIYNALYEDEIENIRKTLKKMKRRKSIYTTQDKIELIRMGKSLGYTNQEISMQLGKGFGLRTVERYSKL